MGRDPVRLAAAERVLDRWASMPPESVTMAHEEAAAEMAGIRTAIVTSDWGCPGGVRRPESRVATHVRPQRRLRRSRRSRADHAGPDVALDAGAL